MNSRIYNKCANYMYSHILCMSANISFFIFFYIYIYILNTWYDMLLDHIKVIKAVSSDLGFPCLNIVEGREDEGARRIHSTGG